MADDEDAKDLINLNKKLDEDKKLITDLQFIKGELNAIPTASREKSFLQSCCTYNLIELVKILVELGHSVFDTPFTHKTTPLEICSENGFSDSLEIILKEVIKSRDKQKRNQSLCSSLCELIKRLAFGYDNNQHAQFEKCYVLILEAIKRLKLRNHGEIDTEEYKDIYGHTALFYANYYKLPAPLHAKLLDTTCFTKNIGGVATMDKIDEDVLRKYFDHCLDIDIGLTKREVKITFNYNMLCPNKKKTLETDVIFNMSERQQFQNLLDHPLITCFLLVKWRKHFLFRLLFWTRFVFWVCYAAILHLFIIRNYEFLGLVIFVSLLHLVWKIVTTIVFVRSQPKYKLKWKWVFKFFKIYSARTFPSLLILILLSISAFLGRQVVLSLIFSLLSLKIIYLLPTYGNVFQKVFINFLIVLACYFIPIFLPFTISYHLITKFSNETETESFLDFTESFYNLFAVSVGEIKDFDGKQGFSNTLVFICFIIIFSVVLSNLLNSLAVYDIQELKKQAKTIDIKDRISFIYFTELTVRAYSKFRFLEKLNLFKGSIRKITGYVNNPDKIGEYKLTKEIVCSLNTCLKKKKNSANHISIYSCSVNLCVKNDQNLIQKCIEINTL